MLPPLVLGGAGFSYQLYPDPASLDATGIIKLAFDQGIRAIDTSPYYEPSEQILGEALSRPEIARSYKRSDYKLMTKVGRVKAEKFDYSPAWVRYSIERSLRRLQTSYLDVVFCHDVEFVTETEAVEAVGEILKFVQAGKVKYIGISGYRIDILLRLAILMQQKYGRPIDVIQNWAQMTLQNTRLEREGLEAFKRAGVSCVCNSSPLAIGLLRSGSVPQGALGDFHPAPLGLRKAAQEAATYVEGQGETLAALAIRYALWRAQKTSSESFRVSTIVGISNVRELLENIFTARQILQTDGSRDSEGEADIRFLGRINQVQLDKDLPLIKRVQDILGQWREYDFTSPPKDWSIELKQMSGMNASKPNKL